MKVNTGVSALEFVRNNKGTTAWQPEDSVQNDHMQRTQNNTTRPSSLIGPYHGWRKSHWTLREATSVK
jgi:hypothetical protein